MNCEALHYVSFSCILLCAVCAVPIYSTALYSLMPSSLNIRRPYQTTDNGTRFQASAAVCFRVGRRAEYDVSWLPTLL